MARLLHEVWLDADGLPSCVLAGPDGDGARDMLGPSARLVHTFEASSHIEAMQTYYDYLGLGRYTTSFPEQDAQTYPEEWLHRQQGGNRT